VNSRSSEVANGRSAVNSGRPGDSAVNSGSCELPNGSSEIADEIVSGGSATTLTYTAAR